MPMPPLRIERMAVVRGKSSGRRVRGGRARKGLKLTATLIKRALGSPMEVFLGEIHEKRIEGWLVKRGEVGSELKT